MWLKRVAQQLTRAFKRETGMGLRCGVSRCGCWKHFPSFDGFERDIRRVGCCYDSASAFCAMFQRAFGVSPSRFSFH